MDVDFRYVGAFVEGKRCGFGKLFYADGSIYEGQFKNDRKEGVGCYWNRGELQFGNLLNDRFTQSYKFAKERPDDASLWTLLEERQNEANEREKQTIERFLKEKSSLESEGDCFSCQNEKVTRES